MPATSRTWSMWSATSARRSRRPPRARRTTPPSPRDAPGVVGVLGAEPARLPTPRGSTAAPSAVDERRHERHHHDAAGPRRPSSSTSSGTLRVTSQSARADEWEKITGASLTSIAWRIVSSETWLRSTSTPEPVQLADDLLAERGEAAVRMLARGRVGPRRVVVVGERQVAGAEPREDPQRAERLPDRVAALDADHRGDPPVAAIRSTSSAVRACSSRLGMARGPARRTRRSARASA